jgi:glycosyltransferase involved in cell wall biosynthesis
MTGLSIIQVCADRGIAPGATKGAAQHLRGIAAGMAEAGHEVTTFAARRAEGPFPVPVRDVSELSGLTDQKAWPVDVVYERYSLGHRGGLDLARRIGGAFVLEVNAPLVDEAIAHRPSTVAADDRSVEADLLAEADLVIAVSTPLQRWIEHRRSGPCVTIPNGFEPAWFADPAQRPQRPTLAFIGHPKPWHGAKRLPAVVNALAGRGRDVELLVIGGGPGSTEVIEAATGLGVNDRLVVTGPLPPQQASALLRRATVGIAPYPSHENFYFCPLKIVDYLAAGLPIVSTAQGDVPGLVGDAGIVVEPDDDDALVDAVDMLLDDPALGRRLGHQGRVRATATMTWSQVASQTLAAIGQLDRRTVAAPMGSEVNG